MISRPGTSAATFWDLAGHTVDQAMGAASPTITFVRGVRPGDYIHSTLVLWVWIPQICINQTQV